MHHLLLGVEKWCSDRKLSVNPSKIELLLFTQKYKPEAISPIFFYSKE